LKQKPNVLFAKYSFFVRKDFSKEIYPPSVQTNIVAKFFVWSIYVN
jgi:hypothetical protein